MNDTTDTQESQDQPSQPEQQTPSKVECEPARDPAIRLFIATAMFLGIAVWCFLDMNKYPKPEVWDLSEHVNEVAGYCFNYYGGFVFLPIGLVLAGFALAYLRRRLVADADGIGYVGKEKVAWDSVTELDAKKLKKGLLYLHYGDEKILTLDSWKLTNFRDLVAIIETNIPSDRQKT